MYKILFIILFFGIQASESPSTEITSICNSLGFVSLIDAREKLSRITSSPIPDKQKVEELTQLIEEMLTPKQYNDSDDDSESSCGSCDTQDMYYGPEIL